MKTIEKISVSFVLACVLIFGSVAYAQDDPPTSGEGAGFEEYKAAVLEKANQTLDRLDEMLDKLDRLYQSADPEKQKDLRRDINEITRLREIVEKAKDDLAKCQTKECVTDQETLVDISDQQATALMEEVGASVGDTEVYDGNTGREVVLDDETMGDDPMNQYGDPEDAIKPSFYDEASASDDPSQGNTGSLDDTDPEGGQGNSCANGGTWPSCVWENQDVIPPVSPE